MSFLDRFRRSPKKKCAICHQEKPESAFVPAPDPDGHLNDEGRASLCTDCQVVGIDAIAKYKHVTRDFKKCVRCNEPKPPASYATVPNICDDCVAPYFTPAQRRAIAALTPFVQALYASENPAAAPLRPLPSYPQGRLALGFGENGQTVSLVSDQRARHTYAIGKSGSGKTTLLKQMALVDIAQGLGVAYLDPHGDAVWDLLGLIPDKHRDKVIYFAPAQDDCPGFNPLAAPGPAHKVRGDVVGTLKRFFESWGPQLEMQLDYALTLLLTDPTEPHCFADLKRVFLDQDYRDTLTDRTTDEEARTFWRKTFPTLGKNAHLPVLNKLAAFLKPGSPLARLMATTSNTLDMRAAMDEGKILLVNLSKGELGEDAAHLIGSLLVTAMSQAALSRSDTPEHRRKPFSLYVDEFQNFINEGFDTILSEARKYKLRLTLAHQNTGQVPTPLLKNITGNVATLIVFTVNADDAHRFAGEMSSPVQVTPDGKRYDPDTGVGLVARAFGALVLDLMQLPLPLPEFLNSALPAHKSAVDKASALQGIFPEMVFAVNMAKIVGAAHLPTGVQVSGLLSALTTFAANPSAYGAHPEDLKQKEWPGVHDFQELDTGRAFVRTGKRSSTVLVTVPRPTLDPSDDTRRQILERQAEDHKTAHLEAQEKKRPPTIAQEPRSPIETTQDPDQNTTTLPTTPAPASVPIAGPNGDHHPPDPPDDTDEFLT